ncbi:CHAT domain-containing tetratricopeptide repeat protein [Microbispora sp. CA-135349]|uniref:CHAT domain-containing tetratricopeptide repeat protein n=1 Tax=Microbispora sp. CA-135349 TaxID=3239953 RepID=UPI003D908C29
MTTVPDAYYRLCAKIDLALRSAADALRTRFLAEHALGWCRRHLPGDDPELAAALVRAGHTAFHGNAVIEQDNEILWHFEPYFEEAVKIRRSVYGATSAPVLDTLDTLSLLLMRKERWQKAAGHLREQISILEGLHGPEHPGVASAEQRLADCLQWSGNHDEAEKHYLTSLAIWRSNPFAHGAHLAWSGWGFLCENRGDLGTARTAFTAAAEILRAHAGVAAPGLGICLPAIGRVASKQGELEEAARLYRQAVAIQRAVLGAADPQVAASWETISHLTAASDLARSLEASREALRADGHWLRAGAAIGPGQGGVYGRLSTLIARSDHHLSLLLTGGPATDVTAEAVAVAAWRRRLPGLLVHFSWLTSPGADADLAEQMRRLSAEQAAYQLNELTPMENTIDSWLRRASFRGPEALGDTLRSASALRPESDPLPSPPPDPSRVAPPDECVVEFIRLPGHSGVRYHAVVFAPGDRAATAVDLGPTEEMDTAALRARIALMGGGGADAFRGALPEDAGEIDAEAPHTLRRLVVDPLMSLIEGCHTVTFVLDGQLLHVPLGALPMGRDSRPLLTEFSVRYANGLDEVVRGRQPYETIAPGPDVVVAAPDFDLGIEPSAPFGRLFDDLLGTWLEGEEVAEKLGGAILLTRDQALKSRVRSVRSPRVLHIASHGYAFSLTEAPPDDPEPWPRFLRLRRHRDPALRSGLALAGVNTWLCGGDPGPEAETGLLTAADIAGLHLVGTDLVVLSACDTGRGDIDRVLGHASLGFAFLQSGVRTVVASLWKVPDSATRKLMARFYDHLLDGRGKMEALRLAQLDMRRAGFPASDWAAFVCYGDAGPLSRTASG